MPAGRWATAVIASLCSCLRRRPGEDDVAWRRRRRRRGIGGRLVHATRVNATARGPRYGSLRHTVRRATDSASRAVPASARQLSGYLPRQAAGTSQPHSVSSVLPSTLNAAQSSRFGGDFLPVGVSPPPSRSCAGFAGLTDSPRRGRCPGGGAFSVLPPEFFCEKWSAHETAEKSDRSRCRHHSQRGRTARHTRAVRGGHRSPDPSG